MLDIYVTADNAQENQVGKWIHLPLDPNVLSQEISEVLAKGRAISGSHDCKKILILEVKWENEELFCVDIDENIYEINYKIKQFSSLTKEKQKAVAFCLSSQVILDFEYAIKRSENIRVYENKSMMDIARIYLEQYLELSKLPAIIAKHIILESIVKHFELQRTHWMVGNDVFEYVG